MIRHVPDNLAHLFLNLGLVDPGLLCRFDRQSEHGEDRKRNLGLLRRERSRELSRERADGRGLGITRRGVMQGSRAVSSRKSKQDLDNFTSVEGESGRLLRWSYSRRKLQLTVVDI